MTFNFTTMFPTITPGMGEHFGNFRRESSIPMPKPSVSIPMPKPLTIKGQGRIEENPCEKQQKKFEECIKVKKLSECADQVSDFCQSILRREKKGF